MFFISMKNALITLAKSVLVPLGLTATVSSTGAAFQKKCHSSRTYSLRCPFDVAQRTTALTISNKEMKGIMKIVKYFEEFGLLIKGAGERL